MLKWRAWILLCKPLTFLNSFSRQWRPFLLLWMNQQRSETNFRTRCNQPWSFWTGCLLVTAMTMVSHAVGGRAHTAFAALPGSWRHERFHCLPTWWNFGIHWQFDESLPCWKCALIYSSVWALKQSKIAEEPHTAVVLLLTRHWRSTVLSWQTQLLRGSADLCGDSTLLCVKGPFSKASWKLDLSKVITYCKWTENFLWKNN